MIKSAALEALKKAFDKYPVSVSEGSANTGDNRVTVADGSSFEGGVDRCGKRTAGTEAASAPSRSRFGAVALNRARKQADCRY